MDRMKILYVAGSGRCGSTLLGSALEQIDGFFSPGELINLWDRGIIDQHPCGCGMTLEQCELWGRVVRQVGGEDPYTRASEMMKLHRAVGRTRHLPLLMSEVGRRRLMTGIESYVATLDDLYSSIRRTTGARVLVDGSKDPSYAQLLRLAPSLEVYVLHLVRDPRAVVFSWQRRKELFPTATSETPKVYMEQHRVVKSTTYWMGLNLGIEAMRRQLAPNRYLRIAYEDFIREPVAQLEGVMAFLDIDIGSFPFVHDHELTLRPNHSVSGNPSRFATGTVKLRADDEWRRRMHARHKRLVTLLSWPLSHRYGYV
jgi:Sulfotransferase family